MRLKQKALLGLGWTFSHRIAIQFINFLVSVVLARLLLPADFGLIGIALVFLAICSVIVDGGLASSLIRSDNPDQRDYSTVFFAHLGISVVVYAAVYLLAPALAVFFGNHDLTLIFRVLGVIVIIKAFIGVQRARLTKVMDFKTQMLIEVPSILVGGSLGIALAYLGFGVWSLIWMNLVQSALSSLQMWLRVAWKPKFILDWNKFRYHFNFGYKLTLSALLNSIFQNSYSLIIGKYFSMAQLGFYARADSLNMFPVNGVAAALNKVTYPMFSSIKNDGVRLKMVYRRLMSQVLFWLTPLLCGAGVLAAPLFTFLFTEKWLPAVPYFQILCITGILYPLHDYNLNILKVMGRSDLFLKLEVVKKVFTVAGLAIALPFGIYGILYFQAISSVLGLFINSFYSGKLISYTLLEQFFDIWPIFMLSAIMGATVFLIDFYLFHELSTGIFLRLVVGVLFGSGLYLFTTNYLKLPAAMDFKLLVLKK